VADVSGKGVSSALLAALLQGALIPATDEAAVLAPPPGAAQRVSSSTAPAAKSTPRFSIACSIATAASLTSTRRTARRSWCGRTARLRNWRPPASRWDCSKAPRTSLPPASFLPATSWSFTPTASPKPRMRAAHSSAASASSIWCASRPPHPPPSCTMPFKAPCGFHRRRPAIGRHHAGGARLSRLSRS
jgi:hypothetical protein